MIFSLFYKYGHNPAKNVTSRLTGVWKLQGISIIYVCNDKRFCRLYEFSFDSFCGLWWQYVCIPIIFDDMHYFVHLIKVLARQVRVFFLFKMLPFTAFCDKVSLLFEDLVFF